MRILFCADACARIRMRNNIRSFYSIMQSIMDLQQNRASFLVQQFAAPGLLVTGLLFLLLLLGQSVAVAPGDEDERCPVPEYPVSVKILMDSWRYRTLIAEDGGNRVWTATTTEGHGMTVLCNCTVMP